MLSCLKCTVGEDKDGIPLQLVFSAQLDDPKHWTLGYSQAGCYTVDTTDIFTLRSS